ncbi:MAG: hypothetical protein R3322_00400 [Kiloniellales bacterium]|nr:hypothetical protein [Kiloniellales bacterium]
MANERGKCAGLVEEQARDRIEDIRLLLVPTKEDVELVDRGTMDTCIRLGDIEEVYSQEHAADYRDEDGTLDLESFVDDHWDELAERARERWYEFGLGFDYVDREDTEHFWRYQISWGGPSEEIRFFANHDLTLYRAEFWYMDWFDGAHVVVTDDDTVRAIWDEFVETETAAHARDKVLNDG